jgi:hypothetical protein
MLISATVSRATESRAPNGGLLLLVAQEIRLVGGGHRSREILEAAHVLGTRTRARELGLVEAARAMDARKLALDAIECELAELLARELLEPRERRRGATHGAVSS